MKCDRKLSNISMKIQRHVSILSFFAISHLVDAFSVISSSNTAFTSVYASSNKIGDDENYQEVYKRWVFQDEKGNQLSTCLELGPPLFSYNYEENQQQEEDELENLFTTNKRYYKFGENDKSLCIRTTSFGCGKLGHQVWPASLALSMYLEANREKVQDQNVLELGAGVGLPSLVCRDILGASSVISTDFWKDKGDYSFKDEDDEQERLVPEYWHGVNLKYNVEDVHKKAFVTPLDWHQLDTSRTILEKNNIDIVIGSDLIYYDTVMLPLWRTCEVLLQQAKEVILFSPLISKEKRKALPAFRELLENKDKRGFYEVDMEEFHMYGADGSKFLKMSISKRKNSKV